MTEVIMKVLSKYGYETVSGTFPIGRPDQETVSARNSSGAPVVAKFYPNGKGDLVYKNMVALWNSSFGKKRIPPGLPRPIDFLADDGILIMEHLPGRQLAELDFQNRSLLEQSVALLADLHRSDARADVKRGSKRIIRSLKRKAKNLEQITPQFYGAYNDAISELESARVSDKEIVSSHGDFSPRNILVSDNRLILIDWDRFQHADPARDVAYYGVWCWAHALRNLRQPSWASLHRCASLYDQLRPHAMVGQRLSFHVAAGLLRTAHSIAKLWPHQLEFIPALIAEARNQLKERQ